MTNPTNPEKRETVDIKTVATNAFMMTGYRPNDDYKSFVDGFCKGHAHKDWQHSHHAPDVPKEVGEKFTGNNYLERVLSDKYPEHDAIHIEGKEELFISEIHAWKAVQIERDFQIKAHSNQSRDGGWISVDDSLPEHGEKVLICRYGDNILMGQLMIDEPIEKNNVWCAFFKDKFSECEDGSVTHWQPLPTPPTQK